MTELYMASRATRRDMFPHLAAMARRVILVNDAGERIGPVFDFSFDAVQWRKETFGPGAQLHVKEL